MSCNQAHASSSLTTRHQLAAPSEMQRIHVPDRHEVSDFAKEWARSGNGGFSSGLFNCFDDLGICYTSFFCSSRARAKLGFDLTWLHRFAWMFSLCFGSAIAPLVVYCPCAYPYVLSNGALGAYIRIRFRRKYGLPPRIIEGVVLAHYHSMSSTISSYSCCDWRIMQLSRTFSSVST